MTWNARRYVLLLLVCSVLAVSGILGFRFMQYPLRPQGGSAERRPVELRPGSPLARIVRDLAAAGVLEQPLWFRLYVSMRGAERRLRAGEYELAGNLSPAGLLARLEAGPIVREVSVTVVPGKHGVDIAEVFEQAGLAAREAFLAAFRSPALRKKYGVDAPNLEGRLYPDTYRFREETSVEELVDVLVSRHRKILAELVTAHPEGLKRLQDEFGFDEDDVVTLASIVEKETGEASERPRIAGVFLNRLAFPSFQPKLLQTDPTIVYGCTVPMVKSKACQRFSDRIRTIQLKDVHNPYNTYTHEGLPPGPIASPGRASLEAVLAPETHEYLYFVSRNDGSHQFSKTPKEHAHWVDVYQRGQTGKAP